MITCYVGKSQVPQHGFWTVLPSGETAFFFYEYIVRQCGDRGGKKYISAQEVYETLKSWGQIQDGKLNLPEMH